MTKRKAYEVLFKHVLECNQFMPDWWVKENGGKDSEFQRAMKLVFEMLKDEQ